MDRQGSFCSFTSYKLKHVSMFLMASSSVVCQPLRPQHLYCEGFFFLIPHHQDFSPSQAIPHRQDFSPS